jgi:hypothetical protein
VSAAKAEEGASAAAVEGIRGGQGCVGGEDARRGDEGAVRSGGGAGFFRSPPDVQFVRSSGSDSHAERRVAEAFGSAPLILAGSGVARELLKGP